ncbi:MAG: putative nucleotidyltransferase with HDIG domain [Urechidicola sp.]|jgi:putative nucleotidyltransferase with HDIG domain
MPSNNKNTEQQILVEIDDLMIGMYIDLGLSWYKHPFAFSRFKITNQKDLKVIRGLGLKQVTLFPDKSDTSIALLQAATNSSDQNLASDNTPEEDQRLAALWQEEQLQQKQTAALREKCKKITRQYHEQSNKIRKITHGMKIQPANEIHNIDDLVDEMTSVFDSGDDLATNLVNLCSGLHDDYNHITNVTMLSLMLGSAIGLSGEQLKRLGTGALLHDIGKVEVPASIKIKTTKLTKTEQQIMQRHTVSGRQLIMRVRDMDKRILDVIDKHHEFLDGSGYPKGLTGEALSTLVRIVTIANLYDNLCNPADVKAATTPKSALAILYLHYQDKLDSDLIKRLIGLLGVYPPGTVIKLNDDSIGLVICSNPKDSLHPVILVYDPETPKEEAMIVDLTEHLDIQILEELRPGRYPPEIHNYLSIQERIGVIMKKTEL